jgi:hypothetical protein
MATKTGYARLVASGLINFRWHCVAVASSQIETRCSAGPAFTPNRVVFAANITCCSAEQTENTRRKVIFFTERLRDGQGM